MISVRSTTLPVYLNEWNSHIFPKITDFLVPSVPPPPFFSFFSPFLFSPLFFPS